MGTHSGIGRLWDAMKTFSAQMWQKSRICAPQASAGCRSDKLALFCCQFPAFALGRPCLFFVSHSSSFNWLICAPTQVGSDKRENTYWLPRAPSTEPSLFSHSFLAKRSRARIFYGVWARAVAERAELTTSHANTRVARTRKANTATQHKICACASGLEAPFHAAL